MKKLSDYKDEEAIELWADLLEPMAKIVADENVMRTTRSGKPKILIAKTILANHAEEATKILLRIDDTPIDGLNILFRLVALLKDVENCEGIKSFFGYAEQGKTEDVSSGSATESTEVEEK